MADVKNLPALHIRETNASQDIQQLISEIKPHWQPKDLIITELSGGVSCHLLRCYTKDHPHESITVRLWKMFENSPYANHPFEIRVIQEAAKNDLFAPLLASFANGYCYTFIPGETMFKADANEFHVDEAVIRFVASNMAAIHALKVPGVDIGQSTFFQPMLDSLAQASLPLMRPSPSVEVWASEVQAVEAFFATQGEKLTICHGDPHPGNVIWPEMRDGIMFLDWEFTHVGYGAVDMAYFLYSFEYKEYVFNTKMVYALEFESLFAKYYLRQYFDLTGRNEERVCDQDISSLVKKIRTFRLGVWLRFIIHHICFPEISRIATKDVEATLHYFIDRYLDIRQEVVGSRCLGENFSLRR